jgi:hypothetical protein
MMSVSSGERLSIWTIVSAGFSRAQLTTTSALDPLRALGAS